MEYANQFGAGGQFVMRNERCVMLSRFTNYLSLPGITDTLRYIRAKAASVMQRFSSITPTSFYLAALRLCVRHAFKKDKRHKHNSSTTLLDTPTSFAYPLGADSSDIL